MKSQLARSRRPGLYVFFALLLALSVLAVTKSLPYASSLMSNTEGGGTASDPRGGFAIGSVRWDVEHFSTAPSLAPFRQYFLETCGGLTGTHAAMCLSQAFDRTFPNGRPKHEFLERHFDPITDFQAHLAGEPGHCINRSGMLVTTLLSVGLPARVVSFTPRSGWGGHTLAEVWTAAGWVAVDPTEVGLVGSVRPESAVEVKRATGTLRLFGEDGSVRQDPYFLSTSVASGELVYPEPWLYTRTGPRFSFWPFRGRFTQVGMSAWLFSTPLLLCRISLVISISLGLYFLVCMCFGRDRMKAVEPRLERRTVSGVKLQSSQRGNGLERHEHIQEQDQTLASFWKDLVCPACGCSLILAADHQASLACSACSEEFPIVKGIPRLLPKIVPSLSSVSNGISDCNRTLQLKTAESFGFEWTHFSEMYPEWESNFRDYMFPLNADSFRGKKVLDAGCGIGRHAYYAVHYGAEVWAVDISDAVEVAARNTSGTGVRIIQADLNHLPFQDESFDLVYSMGVLHHLPDPEGSFRYLLRFVKPGGEIRIFLYWAPERQPLKRFLLKVVSALRMLTVQLPHRFLYPLSYVAAFLVWTCFVLPYRVFRQIPALSKIAERLPLRQYSRYAFRTCVNDQFDRLSAPVERRYSRAQVEQFLQSAGLEDLTVFPNFGWVASGRKPVSNEVAA